MSNNFYDELYLKLEDDLEQIVQNDKEPIKKLTNSLRVVKQALKELKSHVLEHLFQDQKEEIHFFKKIKPRFYCHLILEIDLFRVISNRPPGSKEQLTAYYLEELKYTNRFFGQNQFQYQYYKLDAAELDHLYFLRKAEIQSVLVPEVPEIDPEFSTGCDYLFSKFKAYEMLREHLLFELDQLNNTNDNSFIRPGRKYNQLKWTGDVINVVELGYGLWVSDHLNAGEAELRDIIHWLSSSLNVDLSRYTRLFVEIKSRKLISKTRFIDLMHDAINRYMDDGNALKPTVPRRAKRIGSKSGG